MKLTVLLTAALLPLAYAGMYAQPVLHLDSKSFKKVMANEHAAMVAFVAPWCGHCKNLGPEYTAAAQSLSPLIPFYAVDCDDASNKPLCAEYGIQGFPTIKAFPKAGKGAAKDYNGERKRGPLVEYAKSLVPERVKKLRVQGAVEPVLEGFLGEKTELPHVLLVHPSAPSIPFLWKVLAHRYSGKMHLGFVRDTNTHDVLSSLGIFDPADATRDTARVVAWTAGADRAELVEYDGILKFNSLLEWLQSSFTSSSSSSQDTPDQKAPKSESSPKPKAKPDQDETARRRAKLEEAERRDQVRRAKAEAARAQVKAVLENAGKEASPVEAAPEAEPVEEIVKVDEPVEDEEVAAEPVPEEAPGAGEVESENTGIVHEEL
ncbi:protein disulfide-isomerase domain [Cryptococcus floricola]|uniref:Protein disulfide-isomerase domain n=1 Tax=Cryptococcus floricola TaxID=2591691 RepID=A0A5D3B0M0_9TREE|nr:protein disulfide-isomerase domain [Cryptococcus floricola]